MGGLRLSRLSRAQQAAYVSGGGLQCPFCRKTNLDFGQISLLEGEMLVMVWCIDCGQQWANVYRLAAIIDRV